MKASSKDMKFPKKQGMKTEPPLQFWHFTYNLLGKFSDRLLPRFKGLQETLPKSGLMVTPQAYMSLVIFASSIAFFVTLTLGLMASVTFLQPSRSPPIASALKQLGLSTVIPLVPVGAVLLSAIVFVALYNYPKFKVSNRAYSIEGELFHIVNYMSILSSVGLPPERIFRQLAKQAALFPYTNREIRLIVRDLDLLGSDLLRALEDGRGRSASKQLGDLLEGIVSAIHSGASLESYLRDKSKDATSMRRDFVRRFTNRLAFLAEAIMATLVVLPVMVIILFATTSAMPFGAAADPLNITLFLYVFLPMISILFIVLLNTSTPKD